MTRPFGRIYVLYHPVTGEVRYVGQTVQRLWKRLHGHRYNAKKATSTSHTTQWVRGLLSQGLEPSACPWANASSREELDALEVYWIAEFRRHGFRLTNHSRGGASDSPKRPGGVSEATRRKLSQANRGQVRTAAMRRRISDGIRGRVHNQETRTKISKANTGRRASLESRAKMSASRTGRPLSPETSRKISLALRGEAARSILTEQKVWEIKELLWVGRLSIKTIANLYGVSAGTVVDVKHGKSWEYVPFGGGEDRGIRRGRIRVAGNPALAPHHIREIRALLFAGDLPQHKIAEMFSVTQTCISSIKRGTSWTNVE